MGLKKFSLQLQRRSGSAEETEKVYLGGVKTARFKMAISGALQARKTLRGIIAVVNPKR